MSGASIGRIWEPNRSSSQACIALSCDNFPNASNSSLLIPHCLAIRSAPSNCDVSSYFSQYPLLTGLPTSASPLGTVAPIGTPLINSTPQPTAASTTPPATRAYARFVACCDEPHCASTVVAATSSGKPEVSHALRVTFIVCIPTWPTHPPTTCPTSAGSTPLLLNNSDWTEPSKSIECMADSPPLRFPRGVLTASTITTSRI